MSLGALAGFALVFVVSAWTVSACGGVVLRSSRAWLLRLGPMAERRAAELVAIAPIAIAAIAVGALLWQSSVGIDHCEVHGHHAHLCLTHGSQWIEHTWVVVTLAIVAATILGRLALLATSFARGARSIRDLHAMSREVGDIRIVDSDRAFCFVARGGIYVSSRVVSALSIGERAALIAHETAHLRHGDLRKRALLEVLLAFAAPLVGERVRTSWMHASERLCDADAAAVIGEPATVASAMVAMCRLGSTSPVPSLGFTPKGTELAVRVHAVLASGPIGERAATLFARLAFVMCIAFAVVGVVAAEPLHHAFETLLG